jgi:ubiquitin carboxyl-terminal hydrolase 5/13
LQGKLIYKDECTRCFDSAKTPAGVDVCLKCFNGGCANQERNHSFQHFNFSQHPLTMNIKMVLKERDPAKKPAQITKLAIGKPGGVDADVDDYDTIVTVKCLQCNKELDHRQPILAGLVDSVLLSQSAYFS